MVSKDGPINFLPVLDELAHELTDSCICGVATVQADHLIHQPLHVERTINGQPLAPYWLEVSPWGRASLFYTPNGPQRMTAAELSALIHWSEGEARRRRTERDS